MANLPEPTFSFTIPSLYDGVRLECRLYHPASQEGHQGWFAKGANGIIIAHPYAPLGGCFDDPTVGAVGGELLKAGWIVGTFNLRYEDDLVRISTSFTHLYLDWVLFSIVRC